MTSRLSSDNLLAWPLASNSFSPSLSSSSFSSSETGSPITPSSSFLSADRRPVDPDDLEVSNSERLFFDYSEFENSLDSVVRHQFQSSILQLARIEKAIQDELEEYSEFYNAREIALYAVEKGYYKESISYFLKALADDPSDLRLGLEYGVTFCKILVGLKEACISQMHWVHLGLVAYYLKAGNQAQNATAKDFFDKTMGEGRSIDYWLQIIRLLFEKTRNAKGCFALLSKPLQSHPNHLSVVYLACKYGAECGEVETLLGIFKGLSYSVKSDLCKKLLEGSQSNIKQSRLLLDFIDKASPLFKQELRSLHLTAWENAFKAEASTNSCDFTGLDQLLHKAISIFPLSTRAFNEFVLRLKAAVIEGTKTVSRKEEILREEALAVREGSLAAAIASFTQSSKVGGVDAPTLMSASLVAHSSHKQEETKRPPWVSKDAMVLHAVQLYNRNKEKEAEAFLALDPRLKIDVLIKSLLRQAEFAEMIGQIDKARELLAKICGKKYRESSMWACRLDFEKRNGNNLSIIADVKRLARVYFPKDQQFKDESS